METINSTVGSIHLKYTDENVWKIFFLGEIHDLNKNDYRVILSLLPFLEIGRDNVLKKIKNEVSSECFPEKLIIEAGFIAADEYWASLALQWLVEMSDYDANLFDGYLREIAFNKKYGQKFRHSILKFLKNNEFNR